MDPTGSSDLMDTDVGPAGHKERYSVLQPLGKGSHGEVCLARDMELDIPVAVKFIARGRHLRKDYVVREILNHRMLDHPHIIEFRETFLTNEHLCIVMEYADGGDLHEYVTEQQCLPEPWARWYFQQLIFALDYCHTRGVFMRDVKLRNILMSSDRRMIKLCDFDFSKHDKRDSVPHTLLGSRGYFAPELIRSWTNPAAMRRGYDAAKIDVWTCGVCLFHMLYGGLPFLDPMDNRDGKAMREMQRLLKCEVLIPELQTRQKGQFQISPECRDLLWKILRLPDERMSLEEITKHPWFLKGLPGDFKDYNKRAADTPRTGGLQSNEEIERMVEEAERLP